MKIGSKGDVSPIVYIIIAVIIGGIVLYILWANGLLPWFSAYSEADCYNYFMQGCQQGGTFDPSNTKYNLCKTFAGKYNGADQCFPGVGGTSNCETFCNSVLQTS